MSIDDPEQLAGLRRIGRLIAETLRVLQDAIRPGVTTGELDELAALELESRGAQSGPILTYGYPGFICICVDDEIVHGIPGDRRLREGQLVTLDVAAELDGFHADAAITVGVGQVLSSSQRLVSASQAALAAGIRAARPGAQLREIGAAVSRVTESRGFCVFPDLTGHGIGREMHEEPTVFNWDAPEADLVLEPGMVFTIEPMIGAGSAETTLADDGWTIRTIDGSLASHHEHTIMVAPGGPVILTAA